MAVLKGKIKDAFDKWSKEIEASPDKSHAIDILVEFERIFAHNLVHIAFGEDINDEKFDLQVEEKPRKGVFITKKVSIREAIHEINDQLFAHFFEKIFHPIGIFAYFFQRKYLALTHSTKVCKQNCETLHGVINAYI